MGSKATIRAEVAQIKNKKALVAEMTTKKANDLCVKVVKAEASFELFKLGDKMPLKAWWGYCEILGPVV